MSVSTLTSMHKSCCYFLHCIQSAQTPQGGIFTVPVCFDRLAKSGDDTVSGHVNVDHGRDLGECRHSLHRSTQWIEETRAGRGTNVANWEQVSRGSALDIWIMADGQMRLCHADGPLVITGCGELLDTLDRHRRQINVTGTIDGANQLAHLLLDGVGQFILSLIHISVPTRRTPT